MKGRIVKYLEHKGISRYKFYKTTGLSNGYLDKEGDVSLQNYEKIGYYYPDLNMTWVKTGEGKMLKEESEDAPTPTPAIVWDETTPHAGVPIYDVDFACGFVEMFNDHSTHPIGFLSFPPYTNPEKYAVVYATGDSMSPEIEHRAMLIIGRNSLPASTIFYGDIYGIETITGERTIKRVVRSTEKRHIRLVPSNPAYGDYQDFPLEVVSKVYKVYHVLNQKSY